MKGIRVAVLFILILGGCFYYSPEEDPYKIEATQEEVAPKPEVKRITVNMEILDAETLDPVKNVKVVLLGSPLPPYSLKSGKAKLVLSPGRYRLKISAPGYKETIKEINAFQNSSISFFLEKEAKK